MKDFMYHTFMLDLYFYQQSNLIKVCKVMQFFASIIPCFCKEIVIFNRNAFEVQIINIFKNIRRAKIHRPRIFI